MNSLREWLIKSEWFIVRCDPTPQSWSIWALSKSGSMWAFTGTREEVNGWDRLDRLG